MKLSRALYNEDMTTNTAMEILKDETSPETLVYEAVMSLESNRLSDHEKLVLPQAILEFAKKNRDSSKRRMQVIVSIAVRTYLRNCTSSEIEAVFDIIDYEYIKLSAMKEICNRICKSASPEVSHVFKEKISSIIKELLGQHMFRNCNFNVLLSALTIMIVIDPDTAKPILRKAMAFIYLRDQMKSILSTLIKRKQALRGDPSVLKSLLDSIS